MKKAFLLISCLAACVAAMAGTPVTPSSKPGYVDMYVSQGFQGPECWEKVTLPIDKNGYISIFNGQDFTGWRGYAKYSVPNKWEVADGAIHFLGKQSGKSEGKQGGDIIFAHMFKDFELSIEWKVAKGANSGIFYLARELATDGKLESIVVSGLESQVLDNANHPDAKLGKNGNRQSSSLYDLIPAKPQNQKPYGKWNKTVIRVKDGKVTHFQNGKQVVSYELWTPEWIELLQTSKFSEKAWPAAFEAFSNAGGDEHEGFIGLQDHGDEVWYRNIKVKIL